MSEKSQAKKISKQLNFNRLSNFSYSDVAPEYYKFLPDSLEYKKVHEKKHCNIIMTLLSAYAGCVAKTYIEVFITQEKAFCGSPEIYFDSKNKSFFVGSSCVDYPEEYILMVRLVEGMFGDTSGESDVEILEQAIKDFFIESYNSSNELLLEFADIVEGYKS